LIGLYADGLAVAEHLAHNQWITNGLVIATFVWMYLNVSKQVQRLMVFGLLVAAGGEAVFSLLLGMYTYRLDNVPLYIPFGHSVVYASVYYFVREPLIRHHREGVERGLYVAMILYAFGWLIFADDVLGFAGTMLIVWLFRKRPKIRLFFLVMFFAVALLEVLGTSFGCWVWPPIWFDLIPWVPSANPPSGISVFYFAFDAGCLWIYKHVRPQSWRRMKRMRRLRG
jgi:hypothetical protein